MAASYFCFPADPSGVLGFGSARCIYSLYISLIFLDSGFYCEAYTVGLWRRVIRRSYSGCEANSLLEPVFRDSRDAWKHPAAFGLFGDATGASGQKTRRVSVT